jgi:hypothetical protein
MGTWNAVIPDVFTGVQKLSYLQALLLNLLKDLMRMSFTSATCQEYHTDRIELWIDAFYERINVLMDVI